MCCDDQTPTQNTPTLADPGCLVSATRMCVIATQGQRSGIAPRQAVVKRPSTHVFQNPVSGVCNSERPVCAAMTHRHVCCRCTRELGVIQSTGFSIALVLFTNRGAASSGRDACCYQINANQFSCCSLRPPGFCHTHVCHRSTRPALRNCPTKPS